ncbi:MAG: hypothetical protein RLZZ242_833 [Bacteroidota bacterium]
MILLDAPYYLRYGLFALAFLLLLFLYKRWWQQRVLSNAQPDKALRQFVLERLAPDRSKVRPTVKFLLVFLSVFLLFIGLANPKIGTQLGTVKREGVDIVFAIDVSKSMLAEDIAPNRIEKAKRIVSETLNQLTGDRIGMITYAATAFPQLPITTDYGAAKMFLRGVNTDMMSSQGTAINEAIKLAATYYDPQGATSKVLVLLSDGEDHSEAGIETAAALAKESAIAIVSIALGTPEGAPIPEETNGRGAAFKKDSEGNVVISKRNDEFLRVLAEETNGTFIESIDTELAISEFKSFLDRLDKTAFETQTYSAYKDQFQWFVGVALLLLFIDTMLLERKSKRLVWHIKKVKK